MRPRPRSRPVRAIISGSARRRAGPRAERVEPARRRQPRPADARNVADHVGFRRSRALSARRCDGCRHDRRIEGAIGRRGHFRNNGKISLICPTRQAACSGGGGCLLCMGLFSII
ncbi:hypothetical protein CWS35_22880 [Bradyrhizobium sp. SK17]|nr:hypothetical protein CWS35_22880 [Bradyrhizobium sp. SK17]